MNLDDMTLPELIELLRKVADEIELRAMQETDCPDSGQS